MSDREYGSVEFNDDGELWAAGMAHLAHRLDKFYGVEGIHIHHSYHDESEDETYHEAMVYFDGEKYQLLREYVPIFGHGPSGAAGVSKDDLPSKDEVEEVAG